VVLTQPAFCRPSGRYICHGQLTLDSSPTITVVWGEATDDKLAVFRAAAAANVTPKVYMPVVINRLTRQLPAFTGDRLNPQDRIAYRQLILAAIGKKVPGISGVSIDFGLSQMRPDEPQPQPEREEAGR
jgi:hypothetical protein